MHNVQAALSYFCRQTVTLRAVTRSADAAGFSTRSQTDLTVKAQVKPANALQLQRLPDDWRGRNTVHAVFRATQQVTAGDVLLYAPAAYADPQEWLIVQVEDYGHLAGFVSVLAVAPG